MHILIIPSERYVPKEAPLAGIFQQHQAQALKRAGYKVGVISPPELRSLRLLGKDLVGWPIGVQVEDDQGVPVFRYRGWYWIPCMPRAQMWLWWRAWLTLYKGYIVQYGTPDVVHAHNARFAGIFASKIKRKWHIPYVLTEHSSLYARGLIPSSEIASIKDAFQYADKRIVVSPSLGHILEKTVGDIVRSWEWVPNILDSRFEKNARAKKIEKGSNGPFHFLNVGSLVEVKGQADLLYAFAGKFEGKSDIQLRIGGDGPLRGELERLANELGIGKQVIFLGELNREQVLAEMQACDVYVHSSYYETFGVSLTEALACGKPMISTACGGPECIVHRKNGVLVPPRDIASLGEAMEAVRENVDGYDAIWIRKDCLARFGEQVVVDQLSSIYHQIHGAKKSSELS